ncbi:MAG: exodeoxyribonuclease VII small subunit [Phycisphaerae bacterium]|nr:exodeoxyribonuclease VII small subunit [Phycisphaerae bacterium]|tara:strand:+ start:4563 stop:4817 length:255 start_codon:yes stop_codon:yes gene_type:complete
MATKKTTKKKRADVEASMTFESASAELEVILQQIDSGELGLEEAMTLHRRGQVLLAHCRSLLDRADQELKEVALDDLDPADEAG